MESSNNTKNIDEELFEVSKGKRVVDQRKCALTETTCYVEDGLRHVNPYHYLFYSYCKDRWIGLTLRELFEKEFLQRKTETIINDINEGRIRGEIELCYQLCCHIGNVWIVSGKIKSPDYVIKNNDIIQSLMHRHELPVPFDKMTIIYEDESIVVIDKPSGMAIHPMGRYRHNTVLFYLYKELNEKRLFTVHRLDRLTSGVTIIAKDPLTAKKYTDEIVGRTVQKEYYCMVEGEFPEEEIVCEEPIKIASCKLGVCLVDRMCGKPSKTLFQRIKYHNNKSIVKCLPLTGRMHQIRIHMQWLGFPIVGDPIYSHPSAFGPKRGYHGDYPEIDKIIESLLEGREFVDATKMSSNRKRKIDTPSLTTLEQFYDKNCHECNEGFYATDVRRTMCLHSKKYTVFDKVFESEFPQWYHTMKNEYI